MPLLILVSNTYLFYPQQWPLEDEDVRADYSELEGAAPCNRSRAPKHHSFSNAKTFFSPVSIEKTEGRGRLGHGQTGQRKQSWWHRLVVVKMNTSLVFFAFPFFLSFLNKHSESRLIWVSPNDPRDHPREKQKPNNASFKVFQTPVRGSHQSGKNMEVIRIPKSKT